MKGKREGGKDKLSRLQKKKTRARSLRKSTVPYDVTRSLLQNHATAKMLIPGPHLRRRTSEFLEGLVHVILGLMEDWKPTGSEE